LEDQLLYASTPDIIKNLVGRVNLWLLLWHID
jgi:hypothetical protein